MAVKKEEKRTYKGRVSLFDIALGAILVFAVLCIAYLVTHRAQVPTVELVYTVRIEDVDNTHSGTYAQGGKLYSASGTVMGTIEDVAVSRATELRFDENVLTEDGEYRYVEERNDEKSDVTVTVRVTAEKRNGGYYVANNRVAGGMRVDTMVAGYFGEGLILSVRVVEEPSAGEPSEGVS